MVPLTRCVQRPPRVSYSQATREVVKTEMPEIGSTDILKEVRRERGVRVREGRGLTRVYLTLAVCRSSPEPHQKCTLSNDCLAA